MLCKRKGVRIVEAEMCPDHVHMLVELPSSISVSSFVGYLKGKSTLIIFERHANLKYKFGNRHFWCRGYYVDTVGKNAKKIQEYIQRGFCKRASDFPWGRRVLGSVLFIWRSENETVTYI